MIQRNSGRGAAAMLGLNAPALALAALMAAPDPAAASHGATPRFLGAAAPAPPPSGAVGLCARYDWACQSHGAGPASRLATLALAQEVNRSVNRRVRPLSDSRQYGVAEKWRLPTDRGGDCEDIALLKKKKLVQRGVPAEHLLLATVWSRQTGAHAVLILRLEDGDYVLDNLEPQIRHWQATRYNFMRMQNPRAPQSWVLVSAQR